MTSRQTIGLWLSIGACLSCSSQPPPGASGASSYPGLPQAVPAALLASPPAGSESVSLVRLISQPAEFDGKAIVVAGFAHLEFESQGLYLHREDFDKSLRLNSVWIDVPLKPDFTRLNGRYVIVEGVFRAPKPGALTVRAGVIESVSRYDPLPTRAEVERALRR